MIRMAVECGVDQYITRYGMYTTNVARFLKAAGQHNCGIRTQMTMPWQTETEA